MPVQAPEAEQWPHDGDASKSSSVPELRLTTALDSLDGHDARPKYPRTRSRAPSDLPPGAVLASNPQSPSWTAPIPLPQAQDSPNSASESSESSQSKGQRARLPEPVGDKEGAPAQRGKLSGMMANVMRTGVRVDEPLAVTRQDITRPRSSSVRKAITTPQAEEQAPAWPEQDEELDAPSPYAVTDAATSSAAFDDGKRSRKRGKLAAGCQDPAVYERLMSPWRFKCRQWMVRHVEYETPLLLELQTRYRTKWLDHYFVQTSLLGTHTFFLAVLPLFWWFGQPDWGRQLLYCLAIGGWLSSYLKDYFCIPRPFSPPLTRLTVSYHALEYGLPSTHSTTTVCIALSLIEHVLYNHSVFSWQALSTIGMLCIFTFSVIFGRMYCGMHSALDCAIGAALGVIIWLGFFIFGNAFDAMTLTPGWTVPAVAIPTVLMVISIHPEPVDDCPCFEDANAFLSTMLGILVGYWWLHRLPFTSATSTPGANLETPIDALTLVALASVKIIIGLAVLFAWRLATKKVLHTILPPIFRAVAPLLVLPRRHYLPATDYTKYISPGARLSAIPSFLHLPLSSTPASPSDATPPSSVQADAGLSQAGSLTNGHLTPAAALQAKRKAAHTSMTVDLDDRLRTSKPAKLTRHYDADVLTKTGVYTGIGLIATQLLPLFYAHIGLSVVPNATILPDNAHELLEIRESGRTLPSSFAVDELARDTIALAGLAAHSVHRLRSSDAPKRIRLDSRHAALAFNSEKYVREVGAKSFAWDSIAGLYRTRDGYVRLHTNFPHHKAGLLKLLRLGDEATRDDVQDALAGVDGEDWTEIAMLSHLCVAYFRTQTAWERTEQGKAIAAIVDGPLHFERIAALPPRPLKPLGSQTLPLRGVRVLDLSRVIAAPVACRTLATYGADVLWVTAPHLPLLPDLDRDTSRGKRTTQLDLRSPKDAEKLNRLIQEADVFVQAYRPDSLIKLGLGESDILALKPDIVYATLTAWGDVGPWAKRRGFDSLVQTATGLNASERDAHNDATDCEVSDRPKELPAQALDHAAGYMLAAGVCAALRQRALVGGAWRVKTSLVEVAEYLRGLSRDLSPTAFVREPPSYEQLRREGLIAGLEERVSFLRHPVQFDGIDLAEKQSRQTTNADEATWLPL
ncbi:hypothetical protein E5Q_02761 [Mixia osmundae IAM 14324]|uniref:Phosphatidic acid phosphatase type 2/haloperoxidase domain-containing protein n=2 Tax=Mixia osmundae (strain CBS 9802 / IAM 14324 / JCM 22182 / KY 12970) TaxID=764103 RepID=G7DZU0_MIXOS|nr:hypothetical protein E5Q_02761 [Mixia osmundae IAM 14324]